MNTRKYGKAGHTKGRAKTVSPLKPSYPMDVDVRSSSFYDRVVGI